MSITPEQLEKLAFMDTSSEQYSKNEKSDERLKSISAVSSFQRVTERSLGKALYTCRRCSFVLFWDTDLMEHNEHKTQAFPGDNQKRESDLGSRSCSSLFLQQVPWSQDLSNDEGKLTCPKCNCRVGSYTWYGERCSCGNWITPSLKIPKRRVDRKTNK
ncbi:hypothetical protein GpartN1_g251.t1 [Galdieria partita]|uniref:protein-tyrosine-phosphatase n=1 Tax=Galdieria partita TaxID=83374 RepID=A0A9C7PQ74_9RHOD|nr:hypothetical protein GpartN1_g251.t1 [Galdieria partita]